MPQLLYGGLPSIDLLFDKDASLVEAGNLDRVRQLLDSEGITDLLVFSHGWNNNIQEAQDLYSRYFSSVQAQLSLGRLSSLSGRKFGVLAVFWPSKRFTDEDAIPGGAASASDARDAQIAATLDNLQDLFTDRGLPDEVASAKALIPNLEGSEVAQDRFVAIVQQLLSPPQESDIGMDDFPANVKARAGSELLQSIRGATVGPQPPVQGDEGGAAEMPDFEAPSDAATAASLGSVFQSIKDAALGLLNVTTYYTMKERAGQVGRVGLAPALNKIRSGADHPRIHLIGHSFGGRVVTAAAAAVDTPVATLTLLQAAYSHYGLAQNYDSENLGHDGFFRSVLTQRKVRGPIMISHSIQDKAVGLAYPIASRLAGQQASALGDANDRFGGMGRNGAQKTPEVPDQNALLGTALVDYVFHDGVPNNLNGDAIITSHGDIARDEVTNAMLQGITRT